MRPRPRKVKQPEVDNGLEELQVAQAGYKRCSGCVARKMCDDVGACMYGKKPKGKKKKNVKNG